MAQLLDHGLRKPFFAGKECRRPFALRPFGILAGALRVPCLWCRRVLERQHLSDLSDSQLADIGLTRFDAEREVRKPFWWPIDPPARGHHTGPR